MAEDTPTDLVTLLTRRAGDDPAWWGVVRQYALGHARWPGPFTPRKPSDPQVCWAASPTGGRSEVLGQVP